MDESEDILDQLRPFNEHRFDACMAYFCHAHGGQSLTIYDMVKLHVMTDVFHTVAHGRPVIGGGLAAWQRGPVVKDAYDRLRHWGYQYDELGRQPENYDIIQRRSSRIYFKPTLEIDLEDFSPAEIEAMDRAWQLVMVRCQNWSHSQHYFHEAENAVAEVWKDAWQRQSRIDWRKLIDAWQKHEKVDLSFVKAIVAAS